MSSKQERDYEINEPPPKRRKLNAIQQKDEQSDGNCSEDEFEDVEIPLITHTFTGIDKQQYIKLFTIIQSCDLIKKLHIPREIKSEIAEYATGQVFNCLNKQCENKIIKLNCDDDTSSSSNYCSDYCSDCNEYTTFCDMCHALVLILEGHKCSWCDDIPFLHQDHRDQSYHFAIMPAQCAECHQLYICLDCIDEGKCKICHHLYCFNCFDQRDLANPPKGIECSCCDNYIPKPHKNCKNIYGYINSNAGLIILDVCSECECFACGDCIIECGKCNTIFCYECYQETELIQCEVCNTNYEITKHCRNCDTKTQQKCVECGIELCFDCIVKCNDCDNVLCNDCYGESYEFKCGICNNYIPKQHSECVKELDVMLLDELYVAKCEREKCENLVCLNCIYPKCNTRECVKCGDIDIMHLCEKHKANPNKWECNFCCPGYNL
eukprot:343740_1